MLPFYALLIEWTLFHFAKPAKSEEERAPTTDSKIDRRIIALFLFVLVFPMALGLAKLLPGLLRPETWASRDFTLGTRLLSELRVVVDYMGWTLLPTPSALSFYHDDFSISTGLAVALDDVGWLHLAMPALVILAI